MGVLTVAEIIQQGVELAGVTYDATDTKPLSWLKQWLRSVALGWPWPETTGIVDVPVAAGEFRLTLGVGSAYADAYIHRVLFPMKILYGENTLPKEIKQFAVNSAVYTADDTNLNIPEGTPDKAAYYRVANGLVGIMFNRKPTTALTIQINYHYDPAVDYTAESSPWYLNDDTMIHAIAYKTAEYHEGKDSAVTAGFAEHLAHMLRNDKVKFGNTEDFNMPLVRRFGG